MTGVKITLPSDIFFDRVTSGIDALLTISPQYAPPSDLGAQVSLAHCSAKLPDVAPCADHSLEVGTQAFALVKASSVIVVTDAEGARFSARNRLTGSVSRLVPGAVNTEVVIDLPGGGAVAAIITNESSNALALSVGSAATAIFKASSVIVGAPG